VAVAVVAAHRDRVGLGELRLEVLLRHDEVADHAPPLAHVELVWPVAVVGKLVLGEPPLVHRVPNARGQAWIVREKVQQPLDVENVVAPDARALGVRPVGVTVTGADVVRRERSAIVEVRLRVRQVRADEEDLVELWRLTALALHDVDEAAEQLVPPWCVASGFLERNLVGFLGRENEAKVVRLDALVARSDLSPRKW
jgi:hypothetical protein